MRWLGQSHRVTHQLSPNVNPLDTAKGLAGRQWAELTLCHTRVTGPARWDVASRIMGRTHALCQHPSKPHWAVITLCQHRRWMHCAEITLCQHRNPEDKHWVEITLCQHKTSTAPQRQHRQRRRHWVEIILCQHHRRHSRRGIAKNAHSLCMSLDCRRQDHLDVSQDH